MSLPVLRIVVLRFNDGLTINKYLNIDCDPREISIDWTEKGTTTVRTFTKTSEEGRRWGLIKVPVYQEVE